jgi:raffinose/stachyose/melibiose transport system permease protein
MTTATMTVQSSATTAPRPSRRRTRPRLSLWSTAFIVVAALTVLVPLYLAVMVALKSPDQLASGTGFEWPTSIHLENFQIAWERTNFPVVLANTGLVTVVTVVLTLFTNSMVAWAIARNLHRPFFKGVYYYLLAAMFIPFPIIMLPLVKQTALLHLDNQVGLIVLYTVFGLSLNVFIYTAYVRSIPVSLEESAAMDGASTWRIFRTIIFPLLGPMNATVGILTCVWAWNDFILPLVVLTDPGSRTLQLAQYVFQGQFNTDYSVAFSSYLMTMAPLLVVYVFAQRWVISGVMRGSVK